MNLSGPLLRTSAHNEYRPLGVMGQPVYMNHRKIVAAVQSRLGADFTDYLARPEIDEASRRIHWHASVDGPVRRWDELSTEEQADATPKITGMRDGFLRFVEELEAREGDNRSEQGFAHLVRQALRSPGSETLYMVGDRPVLTLWGFEGDGAPFDTLTFAPVGGISPVTQPAETVTVATVATRPWWRWLLWLLLLLLLLALLGWALRYCGQLPEDMPFIDDRRTEEIRPAEPEQPAEPVEPVKPVEPRYYRGPNGEVLVPGPDGTLVPVPDGTVLPPDIGDLPPADQYQPDDGALPGQDPAQPDVPAPDGEPAPDEQPAPPVPEDLPAEADTPPEPPVPEQPQEQGQPEPEQPEQPRQDQTQPEQPQPDQAEPEQPQPETQQPDQPQQDPSQDQPQDQPGDNGQPLDVPPPGSPNAGNGGVGFMQGSWKSDGGLVDEKTGRPLDQRYNFDDQGEGEVIIRQGDGTECRGSASATRTPDGGLRITENGPVACGDGSVYTPSVTDCKPSANGRTICTGTNPDGSRYEVEVTR